MTDAEWLDLTARASAYYARAGRFALHFARGKLRGDPAFRALIERGLVPPGARVLDLGSGQSLLAALALAARERGLPAPRLRSYTGIELMRSDVLRAREALVPVARDALALDIVQGDLRDARFPACDVVLVLDVLHYLDPAWQDGVIARVRQSLAPDGVLLLRVGDAAAGWRFHASVWVDHLVTAVRGHGVGRLHCRPLAGWRRALARLGFEVEPIPMSAGTPFANVLLVARPVARSPVTSIVAPRTVGAVC